MPTIPETLKLIEEVKPSGLIAFCINEDAQGVDSQLVANNVTSEGMVAAALLLLSEVARHEAQKELVPMIIQLQKLCGMVPTEVYRNEEGRPPNAQT